MEYNLLISKVAQNFNHFRKTINKTNYADRTKNAPGDNGQIEKNV